MKKLLFLPLLALCDSYELEIYKDMSILNQTLTNRPSEFKIKVPSSLNENSFEISSDCGLKSKNLSKNITQNSAFTDEIAKIKDEILTLQFSNEILKNVQFEAKNLDEITKNTALIFAKNLENINELNKKLERLNEFENLSFKELDLKFYCTPKSVKISYQSDFLKELNTLVLGDTKTNNVQIRQNLKLKNDLINDISDLEIKIYPISFHQIIAPSPFEPKYLGDEKRVYKASVMMDRSVGFVEQNAFLNAHTIKNVAIKSGEEVEILYQKQDFSANFDIFIDGYNDANAYTRAVLTPNYSLNANATFKLDGVKVGEFALNLEKDRQSELFFGKNLLINVKKESSKRFADVSFFGQKSTKEWIYEIKNNAKVPLNVVLTERLPISANSDFKVAMLKNSKPDFIEAKTGKSEFKFKLNPNEIKTIEFGYEIDEPKK